MTAAWHPGASSLRGAGGPRTSKGKARSSRNARRHGLASAREVAEAALRDRLEPTVRVMAASLVAGHDGQRTDLWTLALDVGVAEHDLQRVRLAREALLGRECAERGDLADLAGYGILVDERADLIRRPSRAPGGRALDEDLALTLSVRSLVSLERYHQRALARLHRARSALEAALAPPRRAGGRRP